MILFLKKRSILLFPLCVFLLAIGEISASDIDNDLEVKLNNHIKGWKIYAPLCEEHPSKEGCDDGDMALFSGLLCILLTWRRWWCSPRRVDDQYLTKSITFLKGMSLGIMLYLVAKKDKARANAWLKWIKYNRACVLDNPFSFGNSCLVHAPFYG